MIIYVQVEKLISSGAINSNSTHLYGYYEANCRFASTGPTYMPAFWLFYFDCGGPSPWYDEIDIEIFSQPSPTLSDYTTNVHYKRGDCNNDVEDAFQSYTPNPSLSLAFHKYGIEWTPNQIIFFYDDVPIRIKNNNVPDHAMEMIFDLGFRGNVSHADNDFPGLMYVDYVRVYNLIMDCSSNLNICGAIDPSTFDFRVKNNITFNSGCTSSIPVGSNVTLRAANDVTIYSDFTIPPNAEFLILPTQCY